MLRTGSMQTPNHGAHRTNSEGKAPDAAIIRVLIADDHPVVCLGLLGIINGQPDMTVVVTGNRISALGRFGSVVIPANAQVSDARGRFMIPGLQEMHTHAFIRSRKSFPLYTFYLFIANGVTGIRDFGSTGGKDDFGDYKFRGARSSPLWACPSIPR